MIRLECDVLIKLQSCSHGKDDSSFFLCEKSGSKFDLSTVRLSTQFQAMLFEQRKGRISDDDILAYICTSVKLLLNDYQRFHMFQNEYCGQKLLLLFIVLVLLVI